MWSNGVQGYHTYTHFSDNKLCRNSNVTRCVLLTKKQAITVSRRYDNDNSWPSVPQVTPLFLVFSFWVLTPGILESVRPNSRPWHLYQYLHKTVGEKNANNWLQTNNAVHFLKEPTNCSNCSAKYRVLTTFTYTVCCIHLWMRPSHSALDTETLKWLNLTAFKSQHC